MAVMALQQLSGINFVVGYSTTIFESAGGQLDPCSGSMLIGSAQVLDILGAQLTHNLHCSICTEETIA